MNKHCYGYLLLLLLTDINGIRIFAIWAVEKSNNGGAQFLKPNSLFRSGGCVHSVRSMRRVQFNGVAFICE